MDPSWRRQPSEDDLTLFGETYFRNVRHHFGIKRKDRRYHMHVVGKTGMGKSTLLRTLVEGDLRAGNGLALVDPHGDLATEVLGELPVERKADLLLVDPTTLAGRVAFNPLDVEDPTQRHRAASGLVGAFRKIWADSWGPRAEYSLYNTLRALLAFRGASFLYRRRLLADRSDR